MHQKISRGRRSMDGDDCGFRTRMEDIFPRVGHNFNDFFGDEVRVI